MKYRKRFLSNLLSEYLREFPAILLLGPRQAGKSTFLKHELKHWSCFDLEDAEQENLIRGDPAFFLKTHPNKVWFDESQRLPELFPALRVAIDRDRRPGRYVLSGSSHPTLVHSVSETLAGRVGILHLAPFSLGEWLEPKGKKGLLYRILIGLKKKQIPLPPVKNPSASWAKIEQAWLRGSYPSVLLSAGKEFPRRWYGSYVKTYIDRDIREIHGKISAARFQKLLTLLALRQGQILNISDLARDLVVDGKTVLFYLDLLEESFQLLRLQPWTQNPGKRLIKSPKVYLQDSGLCHYFNRIFTPHDLEWSPLRGKLWEGWVISELMKQNLWLEEPFQFYYWRTQAGAEVDLVLQYGRELVAVEIKLGASVSSQQLRSLEYFKKDFSECREQIVIYTGDRSYRARENLTWISIHDIAE